MHNEDEIEHAGKRRTTERLVFPTFSLLQISLETIAYKSSIHIDRSPNLVSRRNFTTDSKLNGQHFLARYARRHLKATITPIYTFRLRNR